MVRLLIADDETWITEGLKRMVDWVELGISLTDTATNGLDAIRIIQELTPEIILIDIRMPQKSGLEVAAYVKEHNIPCQIIIMSGYADFEYAQKALEYGTQKYLVKPISRDDLKNAVMEAMQIVQTQKQQQTISDYYQALEKNFEISTYYLGDFHEKLNPGEQYALAVLKMGKGWTEQRHELEYDSSVLRFCHQTQIGKQKIVLFQNHLATDEIIMVCFSHPKKWNDDAVSSIQKKVWEMREQLENTFEASIGISKLYSDTDKLFKAYLRAKFVAENTPKTPHWYCINEEAFWQQHEITEMDQKLVDELITAIQFDNRKKMMSVIGQISTLWQKETQSLMTVKLYAQTILTSISNLFTKNGRTLYEIDREYADIFNRIWTSTSAEQLIQQITMIAEASVDALENSKPKTTMQQIQQYVDEHFYEPISLASVSDLYYMNSSYLSRTFKRATGMGFNDYLRQKRMTEAAELLRSSDWHVYDIAKMVGYDNPYYFMKRFQESYGVTPNTYRKQYTN